MALVWVYQGNNYRRIDDLNPNQVLIMINGGCDGVRPLINYVLNNVLHIQARAGVSARIYRGSDDALVHFLVTAGGESRETIIMVSKNPADTLFNYYTSTGENIINCDFGTQ